MSEQTSKVDRKAIYAALAAPFPEDAIERSDGRQTGKGYSTTGIAYQYVVNRLNEVLGVGGFKVTRTHTVENGEPTKAGRPTYDAYCEVTIQLGEWDREGDWIPFAEAVADGGHNSLSRADAIKGAYTNGFKKCAAFFGVGRQAYEGTLDDDNQPQGYASDRGGPSGSTSAPASPTNAEGWKVELSKSRSQADFNTCWKRACGTLGEEPVQNALGAWARGFYDSLPATAPAGERPRTSSSVSFKFGKNKDIVLADLDDRDLDWYAQACERDLADPEKGRYHDKTRAQLDAVRAEQNWRRANQQRSAA